MTGRRDAALAALLVVIVLGTFGGVIRHGFGDVDDPDYVTENRHVRAGFGFSGLAWAFTSTEAANWHPLTWLSHMADVSAYGLDPRGHHATNVVLHAGTVALLFLALTAMTGRAGPSFFAAALFGLHPLRVESVAWVAERKDCLSTFLAMATLLAYAAYARAPGRLRMAVVASLFVLGLLAKPMLVTLPAALLLLDAWPLGRLTRAADIAPLLREKLPLFAVAGGSCVATYYAQSHGHAVIPLEVLPVSMRLANAVITYVVYLRQAVWPTGLAFFYPHAGYTGAADLAPARVVLATLVLGAVTAGIALARRGRPYLAVGWLWYLGTLVPVLGVVQVGEQAHADRYTYLPIIGPTVAAVWAVDAAARRGGRRGMIGAGILGALVVVALAALTRGQVAVWSDLRVLYQRAIDVTERNFVAHNNLGVILAKEDRLDEAQAHFEEAVRDYPGYAEGNDNLGTSLMKRGRYEEALAHFEVALSAGPLDPEIRNNRGNALIAVGRVDEGISELNEALRLKPEYALAHFNLAMVLARRGRYDEAMTHFDAAVRYGPDRPDAWANRGLLRQTMGRKREAAEDFREALRLRPGWPEVVRALARMED